MRYTIRILTIAAGLLILASAHAAPAVVYDCAQLIDPATRSEAQSQSHAYQTRHGVDDKVNSQAAGDAWIDQYCAAHPLEPVIGVVVRLAIKIGATPKVTP